MDRSSEGWSESERPPPLHRFSYFFPPPPIFTRNFWNFGDEQIGPLPAVLMLDISSFFSYFLTETLALFRPPIEQKK